MRGKYEEGDLLECTGSCKGFLLGSLYRVMESNERYIPNSLYVIDSDGSKRFIFTDESVVDAKFVRVLPLESDNTTASKDDKKDLKPDYSLIPKALMDQLSYVMMAGERKYGTFNYCKGHSIRQLTAAICRHAKLIESGEDIDKDTSERLGIDIYHWACIAAGALMALHQKELKTLRDDRFRKEQND